VELVAAQGYDETSVQAIVERAGVTKGAFYHHFSSKDELLTEVYERVLDWQVEEARGTLAADVTPTEGVRRLLSSIASQWEAIGPEARVFVRERDRLLAGKRGKVLKQKLAEFQDIFVELIERGIAAGEFRPLASPRLLAYGIFGMFAWTGNWFSPRGSVSAADLGGMYVDVLLDGLCGRTNGAGA
jgi:AcrR family transcriptional regulator